MRSPSTGRVEVPFSARFHSVRSGRNLDGTLVEGLRMTRANGSSWAGASAPFVHRPVMAEEVRELFEAAPAGTLLDATVGGGGHAAEILAANPHLEAVGIDQDPAAVAAAKATLAPFGSRARVLRSRFDRFDTVLDELGVQELSGALFDLGVSSEQLDRPERGFSYRADAPLDMRMDPDRPLGAGEVVNSWGERDLAALFAESGETRFASRIARAIVVARPVRTTGELAEVVRSAIPAATRRRGGHPAKRVFQAVRIAVNDELEILPATLDRVLARLAGGGRCAVLSYHSGEDRLVKERFALAATGGCTCPPALPCVCGAAATVRLLNRGARRPRAAEVAANRRAESARLRAVEKLATGPFLPAATEEGLT